MSADLVWELTRRWNCHQLRRTHPVRMFTTDKGSIRHQISLIDSGISNAKAVDVDVDEEGVIELSLKNQVEADARKPDKMWKTIALRGGVRKAVAKAEAALDVYRPAVKKHVLRKVSAYARAQARADAGIDRSKVKTGRS